MVYLIKFIPIVLMVVGFLFEHIEGSQVIQRIIAPRYIKAEKIINKLHEKNLILKREDEGFKELESILKNRKGEHLEVEGRKDFEIESFRTVAAGVALRNTKEGPTQQKWYQLEIKIKDYSPVEPITIYDIQSLAKKQFLPSKIWGGVIFWIGVVVAIIVAAYEIKENNK